MSGVRVGKFGLVALLIVLLTMLSGCAWRSQFPAEEEEPEEKVVLEEYAGKADIEALEARVQELERRMAANEEATAEAMKTADKALKCCRKEFIVVYSEEVYYGFNSLELDAESQAKIDKVAEKLKADPDYIVELAGHTDGIGNRDYNIVLGQKRADAVRTYLVDKHRIALPRISIRSGGLDEPIGSNETEDGRSRNRRATILVLGYSLD